MRSHALAQLQLVDQDWGPCYADNWSHAEFSAAWRGIATCPSEADIASAYAEYQARQISSQPDWAGFQSFCFTDVFAGDSALVSQMIDRYPSFLLGIQTRNLGIVQAAMDRALADHTLNPTTGIPQLTADAIHAAITTYHLEGA